MDYEPKPMLFAVILILLGVVAYLSRLPTYLGGSTGPDLFYFGLMAIGVVALGYLLMRNGSPV